MKKYFDFGNCYIFYFYIISVFDYTAKIELPLIMVEKFTFIQIN